jgi:tyrosine-protein kinase
MSGRHGEPLAGARDRSLLGAHWPWILAVTLVTVASALALAWALHDPVYRSEVKVVVNPTVTSSGAALTTNMETERQVALSGVVAVDAARATGTTPEELQRGLTVSVPAETTVLVFDYEDRTAETARTRAEAIADAYLAYRGEQAAVLSGATTPGAVSAPRYLVNGAAGLVLGLALGVGGALLRDRRDDSLRGPADLADLTGLPVLARIPVSRKQDGPVLVRRPESPAGEAHRQLRGKLLRLARSGGRTPTVTLFTAATSHEGAAGVATDAAVALALAGSRVLLIDADLRGSRGSPAAALDLGLRDVLSGRVPLSEAVSRGPVERLMLLSPGARPDDAVGELLDERGLNWLRGQIPADMDHVVLHGPPVLTAAETSTLAEHADLVVLVAARGITRRRDVTATVVELRETGAALAGAVLVVRSRRSRDPHGRPRTARDTGPSPLDPEGAPAAADRRNVGVVPASDE